MDNLGGRVNLGGVHFLTNLWAVHEVVEDLLTLLVELLLDETLEGLSW